MRVLKSAIVFAVPLIVSLTTHVEAAYAAHVGCGQVIVTDTTLDSDVGPCPGGGIVIGADNVTLDLNGHTVLGSPSGGSTAGPTVGVKVDLHTGALVRNGTVAGFGIGVQLLLRNANTVERLVIRDNQATGVLVQSFDSVIRQNVIQGNGGTGVAVAAGSGNTIENNVIRSNGGNGFDLGPGGLNTRTGGTTVRGNVITANGADGVRLGALTGLASVVSNSIAFNQRNGVALSEYSTSHLVQGNQVFGNSANGVIIERTPGDNRGFHRIVGNTAFGNRLFDLADENPACDANTWSGNLFGTRNQSCIS